MKKLYVLVFLIMFMNRTVFCSYLGTDNIGEVPAKIVYTEDNFRFNLPNKLFIITEKEIDLDMHGNQDAGRSAVIGFDSKLNNVKIKDKIKDFIQKFQTIRSFFKANGIEMPTLELSDLKGNPWDTIAPRVFAEKFGLKKSSLKSMGLSNWLRETILRGTPLTPEERFMIRLQKALIEKISRMTDVPKIMEALKALLLANSKIPDEFGKKSITDIFGSFKDADTKKAVMLEIMKQLKDVIIEQDGTIKDANRKNTLAELVLDNITDVNMRRALVEVAVEVAKELADNPLADNPNDKYSNKEAFLEQMLNDPSKKYVSDLDTKITMKNSFRIGNEYHETDFSQKLNELIPEFISSPTQAEQTQTEI